MKIEMFNGWYFLFLIISIGGFVGLYFLLKNKSEKFQKIFLFSFLIFGLALHFLKAFIPPYSTDVSRWYRDSWFINICGANILLFPFIFLSKSKKLKDYMFYVGVLSGLISIFYPMEPMVKANQAAEWLDIVRFYIHHNMIWYAPLLMVLLKLHTLSYKRVIFAPICLLGVMLFIMLNQVLQSELGFVPLRGDDDKFFDITYKNSSLIWGPGNQSFAVVFTALCPKIFKTVPVGAHAGEEKYLPWFWLIVPVFVYLTPICFLISLIFDFKNFKCDMIALNKKIKIVTNNIKQKTKKQPQTSVNTTPSNINELLENNQVENLNNETTQTENNENLKINIKQKNDKPKNIKNKKSNKKINK